MPEITISRVLEESQVLQCAAFFQAMLGTEFSRTFPAPAISSYREKYSGQALASRVARQQSLLLSVQGDGEIVGLIIGGMPYGGVASIDWMVVHPDWQGMGLGGRLLRRSFDIFASVGAHKLVLYTETEAAKTFYTKHGMSLEGVHERHWWGLKHFCLSRLLGTDLEIDGDAAAVDGDR